MSANTKWAGNQFKSAPFTVQCDVLSLLLHLHLIMSTAAWVPFTSKVQRSFSKSLHSQWVKRNFRQVPWRFPRSRPSNAMQMEKHCSRGWRVILNLTNYLRSNIFLLWASLSTLSTRFLLSAPAILHHTLQSFDLWTVPWMKGTRHCVEERQKQLTTQAHSNTRMNSRGHCWRVQETFCPSPQLEREL